MVTRVYSRRKNDGFRWRRSALPTVKLLEICIASTQTAQTRYESVLHGYYYH